MARLTRMRVTGFRSLKDVELSDIGAATVLIGPNGSGKSNVLSALQLVALLADGSLQLFVGRQGGASTLFHRGPKHTKELGFELAFATDGGESAYSCTLGLGANESIYFVDEKAGSRAHGGAPWTWVSLGSGHRETQLNDKSAEEGSTVRTTRRLLRRLSFFHFHDTSLTSALRTNARASDDRDLRSDGSNLAALLHSLKHADEPARQAAYRRIEGLLGQIAPFVRELDPQPVEKGAVRLDWIDRRGERYGMAHMSDGTLRALALFAALGQPVAQLPLLSAIDEPELGLHPAALFLFCELVRSVSAHGQVVLSTQSPALLGRFQPEEVVVAEMGAEGTVLRRLDPEALHGWLEDYTLPELYDMNVLGGRP